MKRMNQLMFAAGMTALAWSGGAVATGGTLSTTSPCNLSGGLNCTVTASWTTSNTSGNGYTSICVWNVTKNDPVAQVTCQGNTSGTTGPITWITGEGKQFQLRVHTSTPSNDATGLATGQLLARTTVYGTGVFGDLPVGTWGQPTIDAIEALYRSGVTSGCSGSAPAATFNYCPAQNVTRLQMAIFLERGLHGKDTLGNQFAVPTSGTYAPPNPGYADLPSGDALAAHGWLAIWDGIMPLPGPSCASGNWCPNDSITRKEMAHFLLAARYGKNYVPPTPTGAAMFTDVPVGHADRAWIEQLAKEGITSGCTASTFCPDLTITRAQMALFLTRLFYLPNGNQTPKFFGYFGSNSLSAAETSGHSNLFMTAGWGDWCSSTGINNLIEEAVTRLKDTRSRGVAAAVVVVDFLMYSSPYNAQNNTLCAERTPTFAPRPATDRDTNLTAFFNRLRDEELLPMVVAAYAIDEPNWPGNELSDNQQTQVNATIRSVAAKFSAMPALKIATTYSWDVGNFKARDSYDWQGFDNYGGGAGILSPGGDFDGFASGLLAGQKAIIVPGGAPGVGGQDPAPFLTRLNSDSRVIWMMPFIWLDPNGIRSNTTTQRTKYCQAGASVKGVDPTPCPNL